jgi:hypothetical protein
MEAVKPPARSDASVRRRYHLANKRQHLVNVIESLKLRESLSERQACLRIGVSPSSYYRWRTRAMKRGFWGLLPYPPSGRPPRYHKVSNPTFLHASYVHDGKHLHITQRTFFPR